MARKNGKLKILLAVDDSPYSRSAINVLTRLAPPANCEVRVLHVVEPLNRSFYPELTPPFPTTLAEIQRGRMRHGQVVLSAAAAVLKKAGYSRATSALAQGHIRSTIVDTAEKWGADMILLGSRGRTGIKRVLLGSVSDHVARHAHCSVLIVR